MMRRDIIMQTTVVDKPEDINDMKEQDNEDYKVNPHFEFIIKGALIALVVLTFMAITWKGLSTSSVSVSRDHIEIENIEGDWEE